MKKVLYTGKGALSTQLGMGLITLMPGENSIEDSELAKLKKQCKAEFDLGLLVEVKDSKEKKVGKTEKKVVAKKAAKKKAKKKAAKKKVAKKKKKKSKK